MSIIQVVLVDDHELMETWSQIRIDKKEKPC